MNNQLFNNVSLLSKSVVSNNIVESVKCLIKDKEYINKLINISGNYYYDNSLQFYSCNFNDEYNIIKINKHLQKKYKNIFCNLVSIGCDIFGNQFVYNHDSTEIFLFDIETGDKNLISSSFESFIEEVIHDLDYLIGYGMAKDWSGINGMLKVGKRLSPKIPFILNGQFDIENMYEKEIFELIDFNSSIAHQIHQLPDGTDFQIVFK